MERGVVGDKLIEVFVSAKNVFVFTGAGASKESGLPTFRDDDGEWKRHDPMTFATLEGFLNDPVKVWNTYRLRQRQILAAQPNPGHVTLARMDEYYPSFLLATQNVDDLHERAGTRRMVKIHGDAMQMRCLRCDKIYDIRQADFSEEFSIETLPKCTECSSLCRPNIVWFGEYVPSEPMAAAISSASDCDLMLIVGTSGEVSNGYGLAEYALANGAFIVEINPDQGHLTHLAHFWVPEPSGVALPRIWELVRQIV
jgi:NAD-dependent deacetylase